MKRFPMLNTLLQLFIVITVGLLEKLCTIVYLLLPMGLFMLLMSFRSKNHKVSAISTFTNERSEFQHIFPNFILVVVEPNIVKKYLNKKIEELNKFWDKYHGVFIILASIFVIAVLTLLFLYVLMFFNK